MPSRWWFSAVLAALVAASAAAQEPVRVHVPLGIRSGFTTVERGPKPGTKYVVIADVVIPNTNGFSTASWDLDDFSLVVDETRYHPVARPGLGAVDIARGGVIGPHEALKGNLVFVVPDRVTKANLEFFPAHWLDGNFVPMKFCCLP